MDLAFKIEICCVKPCPAYVLSLPNDLSVVGRAQPSHSLKDGIDGGFVVPLGVGVLDA